MKPKKPKDEESPTKLAKEYIRNNYDSKKKSNYFGEGFWRLRNKPKELTPEEKARGVKITLIDKIKDAYTPTPLGGLLTFIIAILGLLQQYWYYESKHTSFWDMLINLPLNLWNGVVSFLSKLF